MAEEKKDMEFPILGHDVCPSCGCEERIAQEYIRQLKREGKLSEKVFPFETLAITLPLMDPTHPPLATHFTIPTLQVHFDVCKECKTIYCTRIELFQQPAMVQQRPHAGMPGIIQQPPT